jgi:hypothetical protein
MVAAAQGRNSAAWSKQGASGHLGGADRRVELLRSRQTGQRKPALNGSEEIRRRGILTCVEVRRDSAAERT